MGEAGEPQIPQLPTLVVEDYNWETSKTNPSIIQRRALGCEAIVGLEQSNKAGSNDLYLLSTIQLAATDAAGLTLSQLQAKVERTLVRLRYDHPEIAQTVAWEEGQPIALIQYQAAKNNEDALAWAREIVYIRASSETALEIRTEIEVKRQQEGGVKSAEPLVIDIAAPVAGLDAALGSVNIEFVFHTNHVYFDGISTRILVGDFFRYLGEDLSSTGELPDYKWGEEIQNLDAPLLTLLKSETELSGPTFDAAMKYQFANAMKGMQNYSLKTKGTSGLPRTIFHTFTKEQSDAIYKSVKSKIGPSGTPAHLGHAAVFLALLKARPPTTDLPDTQVYVSQSPLNGRRFLENAEHHAKTYYPTAQSTCPIVYENLKEYNDIDGASKETLDEYLIKAARIAKEHYDKIIQSSTGLVIALTFHNFYAQLMSSATAPPDSMRAPYFMSDGINETYIDHDITDKAGNVVLSVNTVRFMKNQYLPWLSLRLDSWRGRSEISLSYNEGQYDDEQAITFLQDTVTFMLQFTE